MDIRFTFTNGDNKEIHLDNSISYEMVEKIFRIYLLNGVKHNSTIDKYCRFVKELPSVCVKEQLCYSDFHFFQLRDIDILKKLCHELKKGRLYQYDTTSKNGDTHACINKYYIPFLSDIQILKDLAIRLYDNYTASLQDYTNQTFEDFQKKFIEAKLFYTQSDKKLFFIAKSKEGSIATILKDQKNEKPKYISKQSFIDFVTQGKFQNNTLSTYSSSVFADMLQCSNITTKTQNEEPNKKQGIEQMNNQESKNQPLNQILYGSPGTGKTHNTIDRALCILGYGSIANQECILKYEQIKKELKAIKIQEALEINIDKSSHRACAKALFDYYHKQGQIEFVTFHQNYGYEEFVEGIKPRFDSDRSN